MTIENPPAFPRTIPEMLLDVPGMTLRDYFAGQIVVGLLHPGWETAVEIAPRKAYELADAMLAARAAA